MFTKIIKALGGFSIFSNLIIIIDMIIYRITGYFVFAPKTHHEFAIFFINVTIFCTIVILFILLCMSILSLRKVKTQKNKIVSCLLIIALLFYICCGLFFSLVSYLNFGGIEKFTLYSSPSHQKQLMFYKSCYFHCLNEAYEVKGVFQRKAKINQLLGTYPFLKSEDFRDNYLNKFHDYSKLKLSWNKDETIVKWTVEVESKIINGVVYFYY